MALSRARERLLRRISSRKGREAEGVVSVEGPHAIEAALEHRARFSFALRDEGTTADHAALLTRLAASGAEVVEVSSESFREFSDTESPQGLLAVADEPRSELPSDRPRSTAGVLILDGVQEPGNVGALLRVAAAFGLERVIALDGTADPWGGKAVRASAGLVFALPVHTVSWSAAEAWLGRPKLPLVVGDGGGRDVREWLGTAPKLDGGWALVLGNEGSGARKEVLAAATARLAVPLANGVESLNVATAGAVLAWALGPGRAPSGSSGPGSSGRGRERSRRA